MPLEEQLRSQSWQVILCEASVYGNDLKENASHIMFWERSLISEPGMTEKYFLAGGSVLLFVKQPEFWGVLMHAHLILFALCLHILSG